MTQITIEVPDALAKRLDPVRDQLPELLEQALGGRPAPLPVEVYRYVLEFLMSNPAPQELVNFKPTLAMQARISELLEKNRAGDLSAAESSELDAYERLNRFVRKFKIRALQDVEASRNGDA
ncbi:MAG: hypothetical protein HOP18_21605 [Deltaproteobacteria bacterium]|nr:hypothetical protein [Deltaproteobacteria bacterium]